MKQVKSLRVAGLPLPVYGLTVALSVVCMLTDSLPANMVGAFFFLMTLGEGMNLLGNSIPVVRTFLGGSVFCTLGGAVLAFVGFVPEAVVGTVEQFVNGSGFLTLYISGLITGSLFNIDRKLLLRASVKLLPVAAVAVLAGALVCGVLGVLIGDGFWDSILYIAVAMTSGGMTAGTVPLSTIYSAQLGIPAADVLNRMAPATVLGNCLALIFAGALKDSGRRFPNWTGNGRLVNDDRPVQPMPVMELKAEKLVGGFLLSVAFYAGGALLNGRFPVVPTYAFMILLVVIFKCGGLFPEEVEDAARQWGRFVIPAWTAAALLSLGVIFIDLNVILANLTWGFLLTVLTVELTITLTAALLGKAAGFYPVEAAIAAGMCTTNMGGSGNVAVLSGANRMELLPFAQIVTRTCGALMLTAGGILVRFFG